MQKRVLICEFHQETNTFNPIVNGVEHFNAGDVFEGERVLHKRMSTRCEVHGAVDAITEAGGEVIPTIFMTSGSGGRVADEALELMCRRVEHYIQTAGTFDAVYAALHGATCTENCDDACGELLALIRRLVGEIPIAASCDLHAKITKKMLDNADVICGYQTYPHVDLYESGYRAAKLCMDLLAGEKFSCAACQLPMLVPPAGYTTLAGAFKGLTDRANAMLADGTLLDFSMFPVQPWLDIAEIATTVLTVARDPETAKAKAEELAKGLFAIRDEMWPELKAVDEIIDLAEANTSEKPVILADSADSPNGGAVGDSPVAAMRLIERGSKLEAAVYVRDKAAVKQAFQLGVGASAVFSVGAGLTPGMPGPLQAEGTVLGLYENDIATGKYPEMGRVAVVRFGSLRVVLCENGSSSQYPHMYRAFGIEPKDCRLVVVKANTSFRAHYAPITDLIYVADTPGAGASNLRQCRWEHLPRGLYPFDLPEDYCPEEPVIWSDRNGNET